MFLQLNPPLPLETPKGKAWAIAMIDYGPQWDLQWITFVNDTGECWTFSNRDIRQEENYTFGIPKPSAIHRPPAPHIMMNGATNGHANENGQLNGNGHAHGLNGHNGHRIPHDYSEVMRPAVNGH